MIDKKLIELDKRFKESLIKKMFNSLLVSFLIIISHLPFRVLFGISDFFYLVLRYIIKYRSKIITENLKHSFPEKTDAEIKKISNKFYRHLCDMVFETIKAYSMSEKNMEKHIQFKNVNLLNKYFEKGESVILLGMHYNNWELNNALQLKCKHKVLAIYNPIRGNNSFEKFLLKTRTRWGCKFIPVHKSRHIVFDMAKMKMPVALALGADQAPPVSSKFWTIFLNQETPFFSGPEKIASHSNYPVFFHKTRKVKRGKYEVDFIPLFGNPSTLGTYEIMLGYIRKMEEIIRKEPEYYLWSHRRWKHKRPAHIPLQDSFFLNQKII